MLIAWIPITAEIIPDILRYQELDFSRIGEIGEAEENPLD
jgi:hypothetical protein